MTRRGEGGRGPAARGERRRGAGGGLPGIAAARRAEPALLGGGRRDRRKRGRARGRGAGRGVEAEPGRPGPCLSAGRSPQEGRAVRRSHPALPLPAAGAIRTTASPRTTWPTSSTREGELPSAIARYQQGAAGEGPPEHLATFYYNQSLAHLQKFEYQPAQEARSHADRIDAGVVAVYDRTWKYDNGNYAVVDLNLTRQQVWAKFAGTPAGVGSEERDKDSAPFAGPPASARDAQPVHRRGRRVRPRRPAHLLLARQAHASRMHCVKCGTAFCRRCHLGAVVGTCAPQCHHLFLVRDGVSGPARNKKLLEVQKVDDRRSRVFRLLSVFSPGAGQLYAQKTLLGVGLRLRLVHDGRARRSSPAASCRSRRRRGTLSRPWGLGVAALHPVRHVGAGQPRPPGVRGRRRRCVAPALPGAAGRPEAAGWPSKGRSRTSGSPTSSSSSGCSGRPAS